MQRGAVSSSQIRSIGHDETTNTLEVEFNNSAVYQYANVTREVYLALMNAGSVGSHFNGHIKGNPAYPYRRV
jgi:hypothetical protein